MPMPAQALSPACDSTLLPKRREPLTMDLFIAGIGRAGTTMLANLLTTPPGQWIITEPGLTRGDMGEHVRQQALRFGLAIDAAEWNAGGPGETAEHRFDRVLAPHLQGIGWGVKEVNPAGWESLFAQHRPRRVILAVRDIGDCVLSLLAKHDRQPPAQRDTVWLCRRLLDAARAQVALAQSLPADRLRVVRYEDFVADEAVRRGLASWLGWSIDGDPARCLDLYGRADEALAHGGRVSAPSAARAAPVRADWAILADQIATEAAEYQQLFGYTRARPRPVLDVPPMRVIIGRRQREKIASFLRPGTRMLEWGAGGSTVWLAGKLPPGATLTSIEHDPKWFAQVQARIGEHPQVRLLLRPATRPALGANATIGEEDARHMQPFVHGVDGEQFDLVMVDGNARSACMEAARKLLAPGATLLLHDAQRAWYDDAKASYVAHGHIGSCPDYPSPHLWWGGLDEVQPTGKGDLPLIVSFYTRRTSYEDEARRLAASCDRLALEHRIVGVDGRGSWEANCSYKAEFVAGIWFDTGRPVLWVDADAVLHAPPELLRGTDADFAVHRCRGWQFASGTIFFNQSPAAQALLERWVARCRRHPRVWDQDHLDLAWEETVATQALQTLWLPEPYCRIFDLHEGRSTAGPVVEHMQASRRLKDEVNTDGLPTVPQALPDAGLVAARRAARTRGWYLSAVDAATSPAAPKGDSGMAALARSFGAIVPAPARVLLLAGGQGVLWRQLSEAGYEPHTIAEQPETLADALTFAPGRARLGRPERILAGADAYDAALCHGELEWLTDARLDAALAELRRVVRGPVVLAAAAGHDPARVGPSPAQRDADWWRKRFEGAGFDAAGADPMSDRGANPSGLIHACFVRRSVAPVVVADGPASAWSIAVQAALRSAFDPAGELLVWGKPGCIDDAQLDRLPWHWRTWTAAPWANLAVDAPARGPAWRRLLVLLDSGPATADAARRLGATLGERGAQQAVIVVRGDPARGAATRHALEAAAFADGWRKSPAYYRAVDYESLHADAGPVVIVVERLPEPARREFALVALREERDLHMDMLREVGERSDAHVIRYQLAAALISPGDLVLDAACGLGYGSYLLARQTRCAGVIGVDGSDYAVRYAQLNFAAEEPRLAYHKAWLPQDLAGLPDESIDVVVSFETLEHVADPQALLAEFDRLLKPGGRIIGSVPNDWADETGKDPNPHHLHVYTLDSLREQFARHFQAQALHGQTASGCKLRSRGGRWTRQPRLLREVALQRAAPPDAEWWILTARKADGGPGRDDPQDIQDTHESRGTQQADATPIETAPGAAGPALAAGAAPTRGIVLAVNCTPPSADPQVLAFWQALNARLALQGHQLVLASTVALPDPALQVIDIPFLLPEFARRHPAQVPARLDDGTAEARSVAQWYGCKPHEAAAATAVAEAFFSDLLETLRPAAVLGWQSADPVTRVLRRCARAVDVPFWAGERGWVRHTLMFDLADNHALGETGLSLGLTAARERYLPSRPVLAQLAARARDASDLARYPGQTRVDRSTLRSRLGIPADATVVALFTHGEPSFAAMAQGAAGPLHELPQLQQRVQAVAGVLRERGCWLLVQEHPFNARSGRVLSLPQGPGVLAVHENVSSLLDAADAHLFTVATLQFDAAFLGKPFGLLSRSALYRDGVPPMFGDYADAAAFVDALLDSAAWPARQRRLMADIAFLYEHCLLDIEPAMVGDSAERLAAHLGQWSRPLDDGLDARVQAFLGAWTPSA